jgi:hypothetical protein
MQSMKVEVGDWEMEEERKERKLFWSQRNKTGFYNLPSASRCSGHGGGDGPTAARRFALSTAKHAATISRRFRLVGSLAATNSERARRRLGLAPAILLINGRPFVPGFNLYSFLFPSLWPHRAAGGGVSVTAADRYWFQLVGSPADRQFSEIYIPRVG